MAELPLSYYSSSKDTKTTCSFTLSLATTVSGIHWDGPHITWADGKDAKEIPSQLGIWMGFRGSQRQVKKQNILKFRWQILWDSFQANVCSFLG